MNNQSYSEFETEKFIKFIETNNSFMILLELEEYHDGGELIDIIFSKKDSIKIFIALEQKLKSELYTHRFYDGNNILHFVFSYFSVEDIKYLFSEDSECKLFKEYVANLLKTANNKLVCPLKCLNDIVDEFEEGFLLKILSFTKTSVKRLDENLDFTSVLNNEKLPQNLKDVLLFSSKIVQNMRKNLLLSPTLYFVNFHIANTIYFDYIVSNIKSFRDSLNDKKEKFSSDFYDEYEKNLYYSIFNSIFRTGYANCSEMSEFIAMMFEDANLPVSCETFEIENGDHVFNVVNRKEGSNTKDPSTWGEECYIVDSWAGNIFSSKDFYTKMKNLVTLDIGPYTVTFLEDFNTSIYNPEKDNTHKQYNRKLK